MLYTGVTRPDQNNHWNNQHKRENLACCIVCDMEEIASPVPTVDNVKMKIPK